VQIESGIPIPARNNGGRPSKYPFAQMRPGDSFFAAVAPATLRSCVRRAMKTMPDGVAFVVRAEPHGRANSPQPGARCWRTA